MATKKQPYECAHCGQPCGVTGHLKRFTSDLFGATTESCPSVGLVPVTVNGEVQMGYACPAGHTCLSADPLRQAFGRSFMTQPIQRRKAKEGWRDLPATSRQLDYLNVLGYRGPRPVTKGQAHDLIDLITKGEDTAVVERRLGSRAITLRE